MDKKPTLAEVDQFPLPEMLVPRVAKEHGYSIKDAASLVKEAKRMLYLSVVTDKAISPSQDVDMAWHEMLMFTRFYRQFSDFIGAFIHHDPTRDPRWRQALPGHKAALSWAFGENQTRHWGYANTCIFGLNSYNRNNCSSPFALTGEHLFRAKLPCVELTEEKAPVKTVFSEFTYSRPEVRVIDDKGNMLGVMTTKEALEKAQAGGMDLVEVNPKAVPPIVSSSTSASSSTNRKTEAKAKSQVKKVDVKASASRSALATMTAKCASTRRTA